MNVENLLADIDESDASAERLRQERLEVLATCERLGKCLYPEAEVYVSVSPISHNCHIDYQACLVVDGHERIVGGGEYRETALVALKWTLIQLCWQMGIEVN